MSTNRPELDMSHTFVNDSTWLTHERVMDAIRTTDPARAVFTLLRYADECDLVDAGSLASQLRDFAEIRREGIAERSPSATAELREPATSPSLSPSEGDHEGSGSLDTSPAAASQAEVASPVSAPLASIRCADCSRVHPFLPCAPVTPAQHVAALSMPFDPSAVSRSRCTFKGSNRPCDPTHPAKCSRASTHSLPEQGPTAPVPGMPMALLGVYAGCPDYFDDARDLYVRRVDAGDSDVLAMSYALYCAMVPANYAPETWPDVSRGDRMVVRWLARNVAVI